MSSYGEREKKNKHAKCFEIIYSVIQIQNTSLSYHKIGRSCSTETDSSLPEVTMQLSSDDTYSM